jgi:hypothetical protein
MIRYLRAVLAFMAVWVVLGVTLAQTPTLTVDVQQPLHVIASTAYGANFGLLNAIPVDLMTQAQNSGIRFWRFPGGRVGDLQDLTNSQIDLFISTARLYNMEPLIHVRLEDGTPENGARLVQYVNIEKSYNVRYWSVGNEPDLFDEFDSIALNTQWRAIAEAMLAVDPTIILVGPDISQFTGEDGNAYLDVRHNYLRDFLRMNGDLVDIVAVHRYPFPQNNQVASIGDLRRNAPEWTRYAQNLRRFIREAGYDLPMAFTEATSHWSATIGGEATGDSLYHAIWWGDVLGRLITEGVDMVAYFNMQSSDQLGVFGLLARYEVRPTYYTYQLYQHFGEQLVFSQSEDSDDVRVYASLRDDGTLTILVINLSDSEQTRPLDLLNAWEGVAEVKRLDNSHLAENIEPITLGASNTLVLPAQSMTLFILPTS